jgi:hypothetical protein
MCRLIPVFFDEIFSSKNITLSIRQELLVEQLVLNEPNQFPSEVIIYSYIGRTKPLWVSLFQHIDADHPDFVREWRYYRDGKSWLLKVTQKKKTVFWLSIVKGSFRTTFYFTDKAKDLIMASALSDELKDQFTSGESFGKIKGITIAYAKKQHLADAKILIDIKLRIK